MRSLLPSAAVLALLAASTPRLAADEACPPAGPDCCEKKICCPTTKTWTRPRTEFGLVKEEFCPVPCCWFGRLFGSKGCCGEANGCGKVRTRKVLVIKVRNEEHCLPACVPVHAPVSAPCDVAPCEPAPPAPLPKTPTQPAGAAAK